jgi:hypothetical protein
MCGFYEDDNKPVSKVKRAVKAVKKVVKKVAAKVSRRKAV